jgi:SAM-dependent methyltransferase
MGYGYDESMLRDMVANAEQQRPKNELFVALLSKYLIDGSVLEIGASVGSTSQILTSLGFEVLASDIGDFFVRYMRDQGLKAERVDATDITATVGGDWANIITQGVSTLITQDLDLVEQTYRSAHAALREGGRLIIVTPNAYKRLGWSQDADHRDIYSRVGFEPIEVFRNQVLPTSAYARLPQWSSRSVERLIGRRFGLRHVYVLEKPPGS